MQEKTCNESYGGLVTEQMGEDKTVNVTWCLSLLTVVHCVWSESEESSSSPAVPCHPSASLTLHFRHLSAPWEPWALPAEPPCPQIFPMAGHWRLALYPGTDRKNTSPLKVSMGTFHHREHRWQQWPETGRCILLFTAQRGCQISLAIATEAGVRGDIKQTRAWWQPLNTPPSR